MRFWVLFFCFLLIPLVSATNLTTGVVDWRLNNPNLVISNNTGTFHYDSSFHYQQVGVTSGSEKGFCHGFYCGAVIFGIGLLAAVSGRNMPEFQLA